MKEIISFSFNCHYKKESYNSCYYNLYTIDKKIECPKMVKIFIIQKLNIYSIKLRVTKKIILEQVKFDPKSIIFISSFHYSKFTQDLYFYHLHLKMPIK